MNNAGTLVDSSLLGLPVDQQFAIHAAAVAIKELDREELEEAFVDIFINILKEHGINADINFNYLNENDF